MTATEMEIRRMWRPSRGGSAAGYNAALRYRHYRRLLDAGVSGRQAWAGRLFAEMT